MVHFASKHFAGLFCLLSFCYIDEHAIHNPADDTLIVAAPPCGYPTDFVIVQDTEVCFVSAEHITRGCKSGSYSVKIFRVNTRREGLKCGGSRQERTAI